MSDMTQRATADTTLVDRYDVLLRTWVRSSDETVLHAAYEFGRELLASNLGLLDVIALHDRAIARLLAERPGREAAGLMATAHAMLGESLVPFEMTHLGFREAHDALRASEERYRELVENANDFIFTTDLAGRLTSVNRAGEILTQYSRDEALSLNLEALVAPEHAGLARAMRQIKTDNDNNGRTQVELEIIARDGRRVPLEVSTRHVYEGGIVVGIQGIARDITDRLRAQHALRYLNQRLEEKVKSIAHALHDEAGQLLASLYLAVAEIAGELPHRYRPRLEELRVLLDQVDDQLRRLAHELRPSILDDLGLLPACQFLAEGVARRSKLPVTVRGATGGRLAADVETALYRVAQEALTNATRHGHPTAVVVTFERAGGVLKGSIRDDGVGFDVPDVLTRSNKRGLGLMGMRERLVAVGGSLVIQSSPGSGTSIEFEVPAEL
jgi:two-component system sensor histidine kinase UhpB